MLINFTQPKVQASTMTDLATHCETVHVHWCIHAASSCLQILLIPYCWSVALDEKKKKKKKLSVGVSILMTGEFPGFILNKLCLEAGDFILQLLDTV